MNLEHGGSDGSLKSWFALSHALELPFGELMAHLLDPPVEQAGTR
jgi:hypothetical protein